MLILHPFLQITFVEILFEGGSPFATACEELYFTATVDQSECKLLAMQLSSTPHASIAVWGADVHRAFEDYDSKKREEFNIPLAPSAYQAEPSLEAKSLRLQAQSWRLVGQATDLESTLLQAVRASAAYIMEACQIGPLEEDVLAELELIKAWMEGFGLTA
jgi:hypothetical protein